MDINFKPTVAQPQGDMAKKHEKEFSKTTSGIQLETVDHKLNEKEQSFKKKIFDLAKMEALVHSDEKLNGIYNTMSENGEDKYGYHHNETIMNMMFNKYVLGNRNYLSKYKMAIPQEKKRRDKSGTRKMQRDLGTTPEQIRNEDISTHNNSVAGVVDDSDSLNGEMMDNNLNLNSDGGGNFDDREYLTKRIEKKYDTTPNTMENSGESMRNANDRAIKDFEKNKNNPLDVNDLDKTEISHDTVDFIDQNAGSGVKKDAINKGYIENPYDGNPYFEGEIKESGSVDLDAMDDKLNKSGVSTLHSNFSDKSVAQSNKEVINNPDPLSVNNKKDDYDGAISKGEIGETTSAGGSAGAFDGESRADGYQYSGPFGGKRNTILDKPIWDGGQTISESNYIAEPEGFEVMFNELNESKLRTPSLYQSELREEGGDNGLDIMLATIKKMKKLLDYASKLRYDTPEYKEIMGLVREVMPEIDGVMNKIRQHTVKEDTNDDSVVPMAEAGDNVSLEQDRKTQLENALKNANDVIVSLLNSSSGEDTTKTEPYKWQLEVAKGIAQSLGVSWNPPKPEQSFWDKVKKATGFQSKSPEQYNKENPSMVRQTKNKSAFEGVDAEGNPLVEHHLDTREDQVQYILQNGQNKFGDADMLNHMGDEDIHRIYLEVEKSQGVLQSGQMDERNIITSNNLNDKSFTNKEIIKLLYDNFGKTQEPSNYYRYLDVIERLTGDRDFEEKFEDLLNEKAKSKSQQQFMGMVHAAQKGDLDNPSAEVEKVAGNMKPDDVEDFASTKHKGLPEKVKEAEFDAFDDTSISNADLGLDDNPDEISDSGVKKNNKLEKDELFRLLDNLRMASPDEENNLVSKFIGDKGMKENSFLDAINKIQQSGQAGSYESDLNFLIHIVNDIKEIKKEQGNPVLGNTHPDVSYNVHEADETSTAFNTIMRKLATTIPDLAKDNNALVQHTNHFLGAFFNGKTADEVLAFIEGNPDKFTQLEESMINPEAGTSIMDTMKDMGTGAVSGIGGIGENINNNFEKTKQDAQRISKKEGVAQHVNKVSDNNYEVSDWYDKDSTVATYENGHNLGESENKLKEEGHCRKDEKPVAGVIAGREGSCEKKNKQHLNPEDEGGKNKHNVKARTQRHKERDNTIADKKSEYNIELEKSKKHMEHMKKVNEGLSEDAQHSSMTNLDRLKKDNKKNSKSDMKDSNTKQTMDAEVKMQAIDQIEQVGDTPYANGEAIEKEVLKKTKGEAFKNEGDSTNKKGDEIPKRNYTDDEAKDVDLFRAGQEDWDYENDVDGRFEERMKEDMGDDMHKKRVAKREDKEGRLRFEKDRVPVSTSTNEGGDVKVGGAGIILSEGGTDFHSKNVDGKLVFESKNEQLVTGKYRDVNGTNKFVDFRLSEAVETENVDDMIKLNLDGLGNRYSTVKNNGITENFDMRSVMDAAEFFFNGTAVVKKTIGKQNLSEGEVNEKPAINEELEKMKKLMGYQPSNFVDTNGTKKNRNF